MVRFQILPGNITAEITSADISGLLNKLVNNGVQLQNIQYCDDLTVRITVRRDDYPQLVTSAEKLGAVVKKNAIFGLSSVAGRFIKRPVLMTFMLLIFFLSCYVPSRIFFFRVDGDAQVSERYILEVAAECGFDFGARRRVVRSEIMKNKLLEKIPQLQWAGINTSGCTAVISVRERAITDKQDDLEHQVTSIVASRDGIIQSCTVRQGNALCTVGQAVKAGQVLVSGYLDCGIITKTTQADAEIKALTFRDLEVVSLYTTVIKGAEQGMSSKYALRIGKKLIKFYKDSGNLDTTCGKIYEEEYIYLPGGFCLPIALIRETEIYYDESGGEVPVSDGGEWLKDFTSNHLKDTMISGQIVSTDLQVIPEDGVFRLRGRYVCTEMIGHRKYEEFIPRNEGT